ncbi:hypothetical protein P0D88_44365 [Paraburkholderia sp. RL18-103-BIB-C]|uniref:hypothetical protein n=1 Tax=Paraburkholderia sp. RL18-103-BIB-C TaxID=3031637 RepID=UPI0038BB14E3
MNVETNVGTTETEIGELETTVNALVFRPPTHPSGILAVAQIESCWSVLGISASNRQRLDVFLDLPGNDSAERFATASDDEIKSLEVAS